MTDFLWKNYFKRTTEEKEINAILKENILFADLSFKQLNFVTNIVHLRKYRTSEVVFRQGEMGVGMYIIASGHVNITKEETRSDKTKSENGIIITKLKAGDFFGELSLVEENGRRSAMAIDGPVRSLHQLAEGVPVARGRPARKPRELSVFCGVAHLMHLGRVSRAFYSFSFWWAWLCFSQ